MRFSQAIDLYLEDMRAEGRIKFVAQLLLAVVQFVIYSGGIRA